MESGLQVVLQTQADSSNSPNSTAPHTGSPDTSQLRFPAPRPQSAPHPQAGQAPLIDSCLSLGYPDTSPPASGGAPGPPQARGIQGSGSGRLWVQSPLPSASWTHLPGSLALLFQNCLLFSAAIAPTRGEGPVGGSRGRPATGPRDPAI